MYELAVRRLKLYFEIGLYYLCILYLNRNFLNVTSLKSGKVIEVALLFTRSCIFSFELYRRKQFSLLLKVRLIFSRTTVGDKAFYNKTPSYSDGFAITATFSYIFYIRKPG